MKKIFILIIALTAFSCGKNKNQEPQVQQEIKKNSVEMRTDQINMADIKTGKIEKRLVSEIVNCTGTIEVPPNNKATVIAPMGGYIKKTFFVTGNYVKKGALLAILEDPEYINLQEQYLEAQNQVTYYKEEFKRQGELAVENAASLKKMQMAQADYGIIEAKYMGLKAKLEFMGINPDSLYVDGITSTLNIYAPISGYISEMNANLGKYVSAREMLYQVINKEHLHLHLKVFEKDIHKIKPGQKIRFTTFYNPDREFTGEVYTMGQMVDEEQHTVGVHGHIDGREDMFIQGLFVNAKIILDKDSVYALPSDAVVKSNTGNIVFERTGNIFRKMPVITGTSMEEYMEIKNVNDSLLNADIVIAGAYYLNAELEKQK
jgi:membrane fusion protein, heavy metal efflux system